VYIGTAEVLGHVFVSHRCSNNANFVRQKVRITQYREERAFNNKTQLNAINSLKKFFVLNFNINHIF